MLPEYRHAGYRWNRNKMLRKSYFLVEVNPIQILLGQYTQSYLDCTMNLWNLPFERNAAKKSLKPNKIARHEESTVALTCR